ncbi:hypothetical protein [Flavobacterium sp. NRK F7]|uniref:hypothetical protein n=1 Tax=Flavobacterium sp. NRK F7 TaxID=2954930 RepID=UPI002091D9DF|nr:hypothetical protein [Flavobacterium sp. NRK F7]MCO6161227.1 hypothetical protein [Flavobacterium sp. NRK F7]
MIIENTIEETLAAIDKEILNGENHDKREFVRKILNYPAMMVPSVQESIIKAMIKFLPENRSLIDPFMGAANSLVAGMKYGFNVYGQDINPLSILISQVKTADYNIQELNDALTRIKLFIENDNGNAVDINFNNITKWFKLEVQQDLSKLRRAILSEKDLYIRKFFWVALAEVVRNCSNDRTSTFKMHIRTSEEIQNRKIFPLITFLNLSKKSIADIEDFRNSLEKENLLENGKYIRTSEVKWGNSMHKVLTDKKFQLLLTSPPYGDNHTTVTYGQFSYLPLQWIPVNEIDETITLDYLKVINEIDSNSLGGKNLVSSKELEDKLFPKSTTLKEYFNFLNPDERNKAKKVLNFINDLNITIDNVLDKMDVNSHHVWTIGNRNVNNKEVKNDKILIELLESKGLFLVTDLARDILSKRMPGRNNFSDTMSKEKILIFKKPF